MSALTDAIKVFATDADLLGSELGAPKSVMTTFDAGMSQLEGAADGENPAVVAVSFAIAAVAVAAIAPEVLATAASALVGEEAVIGAAALVDGVIADLAPAVFSVTNGTAIVGTASATFGEFVVGEAASQIATDLFTPTTSLLTTPSAVSTTTLSGPANVSSGYAAVIAQGDNISLGNGAQVGVLGNNNTLAPAGNDGILIDGGSGNSISLGSLSGTLDVSASTLAASPVVTSEGVDAESSGAIIFDDGLGDQIASYSSGQLTGGSITINSSEIDVDNSSGQIQNSTQDMSLGNGLTGVLDNVYNYATAGIYLADIPNQIIESLSLNDSGVGIATAWYSADLYFYQNGTETPITNKNGTPFSIASGSSVMVDNDGEVLIKPILSNTLTIYSGANIENFPQGTATTLTLPFSITAISPNGTFIMGGTALHQINPGPNSSNTYSSVQIYSRSTGTAATINLPTYTYPDGQVAYFSPTAINDNGLIVGTYQNSELLTSSGGSQYYVSGNGDVAVSAIYNTNTGATTIISDPSAANLYYKGFLPNGYPYDLSAGTLGLTINDSGEVLGEYSKLMNVNLTTTSVTPYAPDFFPQMLNYQAFVYVNGAYSDVNIPGVTPQLLLDPTYLNGAWYSPQYETSIESPLSLTGNGTIAVQAVGDLDSSGTIVPEFDDTYVISPGGTAISSTLEMTGTGTVDLRGQTQLASSTVNLAAGNNNVFVGAATETINGRGGSNTFNVTSSTIGATINGSVGQNTLDVSGGGAVTMGSNISGIQTVNLEAAPQGQTQPAYVLTVNSTPSLSIDDLSSTDDTFILSATGNDSVDGGGGPDTVIFPGGSANYTLTMSAGNATVTDKTTGAVDTLTAIQTLEFIGGGDTIAFTGGSGDAASLYSTVGAWDTVTGSNGTVNLTSAQASVLGSGDTINFTGGSGNAVSLYGTAGNWDTVSGSGGTITLDNAQALITGSDTVIGSGGSNTALFSGDRSGYTVSHTATSATVTNIATGAVDTLTGVQTLQFADVMCPWNYQPPKDFNGDGTSDILFTNTSGTLVDWTLKNGTYSGWNGIGTASGWTVAGTGDFNGDGTSDVLFTNASGTLVDWTLKNGTYSGWNGIGSAPGWTVAGTGDFNGDGTSDILFQNGSGEVVDWTMKNGTFAGWSDAGNAAGWKVAGTGDFNGDGTSDILFQNGSGEVVDWMLKNGTFAGWSDVGNAAGWKVAGTGDFNGDGTSDILFQNGSGEVVDWMLKNGAFSGWNDIGNASGWTVAGTGDYSGNGTSGILFQNGSGEVVDWMLKNGAFSGWHDIGNAAGWKAS